MNFSEIEKTRFYGVNMNTYSKQIFVEKKEVKKMTIAGVSVQYQELLLSDREKIRFYEHAVRSLEIKNNGCNKSVFDYYDFKHNEINILFQEIDVSKLVLGTIGEDLKERKDGISESIRRNKIIIEDIECLINKRELKYFNQLYSSDSELDVQIKEDFESSWYCCNSLNNEDMNFACGLSFLLNYYEQSCQRSSPFSEEKSSINNMILFLGKVKEMKVKSFDEFFQNVEGSHEDYLIMYEILKDVKSKLEIILKKVHDDRTQYLVSYAKYLEQLRTDKSTLEKELSCLKQQTNMYIYINKIHKVNNDALYVILSDGRSFLLQKEPLIKPVEYKKLRTLNENVEMYSFGNLSQAMTLYDGFSKNINQWHFIRNLSLSGLDYTSAFTLKEGDVVGEIETTDADFDFHPDKSSMTYLRLKIQEKLQESSLSKREIILKQKYFEKNSFTLVIKDQKISIPYIPQSDAISYQDIARWGHYAVENSEKKGVNISIDENYVKINNRLISLTPYFFMNFIPCVNNLSVEKVANLLPGECIGFQYPFTRITIDDQEYLSDGYYVYPMQRPTRMEWNDKWLHIGHAKGISVKNWGLFLEILRGLYHEDILDKHKISLQGLRKVHRDQNDQKIKRLAQCFGRGLDLKSVYVGEKLVFQVGSFWIVDSPEYGALYFFGRESSAKQWATGELNFRDARQLAEMEGGTYIIHKSDWEEVAREFLKKSTLPV